MLSKKMSWTSIMLGGFLATGLLAGKSFAETSAPTISGFVDTTYIYNFNKPYNQTNPFRSFDAKDNNIALNAAQLQLAGTAGDAGYVVKLLAGSDALAINQTSNGLSATSDVIVEEAYLTYKCPITAVNLKVGKFVTTEGIEVIESKDNPTISRGCLFGMAEPFTNVGALVSRTFGKFDIGAGVVNGWDVTTDNNSGKTLIGKVNFTLNDQVSLLVSGLHGPEQTANYSSSAQPSVVGNNRDSLDGVLTFKMIPKVTIFAQGNIGTEKQVADFTGDGIPDRNNWSGAALEPVVSITDKFSIGGRLEYMYDKYGSRMGSVAAPGAVTDHLATTNFTITPGYKLTDTTTVRAEYRYDTSNRKAFVDDAGTLKDSESTVSLEFIQTF